MDRLQEWLDIAIHAAVVLMMAAIVFMTAELYQRYEAEAVVYISTDTKALIKELWPDEWTVAYAIVMAESRFDAGKIGDKKLTYEKDGAVYGDSIGVFQIRTFPDRPHRELLKDAYINVHYAHQMYKKQGWRPWSAYKNKSYKKFLPVLRPDNVKIRYKEV